MRKIILFLTIVVTICSSIFIFAACDKKSNSLKYSMDSKYEYLANIPYDDYLIQSTPEDGAINAKDYGLSEDNGYKENTDAINNAIKEATKEGGTVYIPVGTYKISEVILLSDVTLHIEKGATLIKVSYEESFNLESGYGNCNSVIYANGAKNIKITGGGRISANGQSYYLEAKDSSPFFHQDNFHLKTYIVEHRKRIRAPKDEKKRHHTLYLVNCENVEIDSIWLYDAAFWTANFVLCDGMKIKNLIIDNDVHIANTDGVDIVCSSNVEMEKCFIVTADDGICIKSEEPAAPMHDVKIKDCIVMTLANNFKIGTGTHDDIYNVEISDCYFFMADIAGGYSGIAVEACDGSNVYNVTCKNIKMDNVAAPILVWLGTRGSGSSLHDVTIENIEANNVDIASAISGVSDSMMVENVTLKNIYVKYREADQTLDVYNGNSAYEGANISDYPEITRVSHLYILNHELSYYWDIPYYGLFVRHAKNVTVENMTVIPRSTETREKSNI